MAFTVLPKENPARRNKHDSIQIERRVDGEMIGPDLSWTIDWHPKTREWWDAWRRSPQAILFEETDWEELQSSALIHHAIWNNPKSSVAQISAGLAELRQRVAKFGATIEDRLKLRMKFAETTTAEARANQGPQIENRKSYKALLGETDDS